MATTTASALHICCMLRTWLASLESKCVHLIVKTDKTTLDNGGGACTLCASHCHTKQNWWSMPSRKPRMCQQQTGQSSCKRVWLSFGHQHNLSCPTKWLTRTRSCQSFVQQEREPNHTSTCWKLNMRASMIKDSKLCEGHFENERIDTEKFKVNARGAMFKKHNTSTNQRTTHDTSSLCHDSVHQSDNQMQCG